MTGQRASLSWLTGPGTGGRNDASSANALLERRLPTRPLPARPRTQFDNGLQDADAAQLAAGSQHADDSTMFGLVTPLNIGEPIPESPSCAGADTSLFFSPVLTGGRLPVILAQAAATDAGVISAASASVISSLLSPTLRPLLRAGRSEGVLSFLGDAWADEALLGDSFRGETFCGDVRAEVVWAGDAPSADSLPGET